MSETSSKKEAIKISQLLTKVFGKEHFPIKIEDIAISYSKEICSNKDCKHCNDKDCLYTIIGDKFDENFDGCLKKTPYGWVIIYNNSIKYSGRINFTLAHEFGHYILHRKQYPDGLKCDKKDIIKDENKKTVEKEANIFASYLLMPLDDFREVSKRYSFSIELFKSLSDRYNTSVTATVIRWIDMTDKMAMAVFSDNGFIEWKKQSTALLKKKIFQHKRESPEELPSASLSAQIDSSLLEDHEKNQKNIWCNHSFSEEIVFNAPHLESKITIVLFNDLEYPLEEEKEEDCFDKLSKFV